MLGTLYPTTMDRGAARSRKRTSQADKVAAADNAKLTKLLAADKQAKGKGKGKRERDTKGPKRPQKRERDGEKKPGKEEREEAVTKKRKVEDFSPDRFKPKAIRQAHALVYSQAPFAVPPPAERLEGVTRVDLEGSECSDVSWLPAGVTWLNLKGCPISKGWDVVGNLSLTGGLSVFTLTAVLNISACGLASLPEELKALKGLKALVAMNNNWEELDDAVVGQWKELNSLSECNLFSSDSSCFPLPEPHFPT